MAYKTLMLQIVRPSAHKRALLDLAMLRYARALQFLLDKFRDTLETCAWSDDSVPRGALLGLVDRQTAKELNRFDVQPFKDSLKIEFASIASAYIAGRKRNAETGYPCVDARPGASLPELIDRYDRGLIGARAFGQACDGVLSGDDRIHPLYFGRYAVNRDYCLLYDIYTGRFYARLTLLNSAQRETPAVGAGRLSLHYVAQGMSPVINRPGKRNFIIVPLAFGRQQYEDLKRAVENPAILHTARLVKKEGKYYLMVNIACAPAQPVAALTTMGVARDFHGGLHYTVCDKGGEILAKGNIRVNSPDDQVPFALAKEIARIALRRRAQVILASNGGKNDGVYLNAAGTALSVKQYTDITETLSYKLPDKGLPQPVLVSANGLYSTCPRCESRTRRNILSGRLFACVECGYAADFETVGSENLAKRLILYRHDKVPVYACNSDAGLRFYNQTLQFECLIPADSEDYSQMYYELNLLVHGVNDFITDRKKYAMMKKLRESPNIKDAIRIVYK